MHGLDRHTRYVPIVRLSNRADYKHKAAGLGTHTAELDHHGKGPCYTLDTGSSTFSDPIDFHKDFTAIGSQISQVCKDAAHAVIYVLVTDEECQRPTVASLTLCLRLHLLGRSLVPHLVPLSLLTPELHLLPRRSGRSPSWHRSQFTRLAFALYDRLSVTVQRQQSKRLEQLSQPSRAAERQEQIANFNRDTRTCTAPAFKIFPSRKPLITFSTAWPPPTLDILDRHRLFHVAYSATGDGKWLFLASIDEKGEHSSIRARYIEGLEAKLLIRRVWNFAKEAIEAVNVEWRLNIVRQGDMPIAELRGVLSLHNGR